MRKHYRNGDGCYLGNCDGCSPSMIQGVLCHETGCPDAWRDHAIECKECGCEFLREERYQVLCNDCINDRPDDGLVECSGCGFQCNEDSMEDGVCEDCDRDSKYD